LNRLRAANWINLIVRGPSYDALLQTCPAFYGQYPTCWPGWRAQGAVTKDAGLTARPAFQAQRLAASTLPALPPL